MIVIGHAICAAGDGVKSFLAKSRHEGNEGSEGHEERSPSKSPFMIFSAFKTFMFSFLERSSAIEQPSSTCKRLLRQAQLQLELIVPLEQIRLRSPVTACVRGADDSRISVHSR